MHFKRSSWVMWLTIGTLFLPLVQMVAPFLKEGSVSEKRILRPFPSSVPLNIDELTKWDSDFEKYFNDHFGFRNSLLGVGGLANAILPKPSTNSKIITGEHGWLFYNPSTDGASLKDFMGQALFSEAEVSRIVNNLSEVQEKVKQLGAILIVVLAPNKESVYPEFLPAHIRTFRGTTRADQLLSAFSKSNLIYLDLRARLVAEKANISFPLFLKTDTHWTQLGAFVGFEGIRDAIQMVLPEQRFPSLSDFEITKLDNNGEGDLAALVNMQGLMKDTEVSLNPRFFSGDLVEVSPHEAKSTITLNKWGKGTVLIFRDSMANHWIPWLSRSFAKTVSHWQPEVDLGDVKKEKPSIVLLEFVERYSQFLAKAE